MSFEATALLLGLFCCIVILAVWFYSEKKNQDQMDDELAEVFEREAEKRTLSEAFSKILVNPSDQEPPTARKRLEKDYPEDFFLAPPELRRLNPPPIDTPLVDIPTLTDVHPTHPHTPADHSHHSSYSDNHCGSSSDHSSSHDCGGHDSGGHD